MRPIVVSGKKYHARFAYSLGKKKGKKDVLSENINRKGIVTTCEISSKPVDNQNNNDYTIVSSQSTTRYRGRLETSKVNAIKADLFRRIDGIAISFLKATTQVELDTKEETRELRKKLWDEANRVYNPNEAGISLKAARRRARFFEVISNFQKEQRNKKDK
jgi:hypothetical protein